MAPRSARCSTRWEERWPRSPLMARTTGTTPTQRDRHIGIIAGRGRLGWQRASGYNWRALVEADVARFKRVIGDGLRSQADGLSGEGDPTCEAEV